MNIDYARGRQWICHKCATTYGAVMHPAHIATYHKGTCGVCETEQIVTEPRDYSWRMAYIFGKK